MVCVSGYCGSPPLPKALSHGRGRTRDVRSCGKAKERETASCDCDDTRARDRDGLPGDNGAARACRYCCKRGDVSTDIRILCGATGSKARSTSAAPVTLMLRVRYAVAEAAGGLELPGSMLSRCYGCLKGAARASKHSTSTLQTPALACPTLPCVLQGSEVTTARSRALLQACFLRFFLQEVSFLHVLQTDNLVGYPDGPRA